MLAEIALLFWGGEICDLITCYISMQFLRLSLILTETRDVKYTPFAYLILISSWIIHLLYHDTDELYFNN